MVANRRRDTSPELALRSALHRSGLRFRVDQPLPFDRRRRADIVFPRQKIAVFVDGCFWHGCPEHYSAPKANADYWREKVERNQGRDRDTDERLHALGWAVIRVWEHEVPVTTAVERIRAEVTTRRSASRAIA